MIPYGFKFRQRDEQLIKLFLKPKIFGDDPRVNQVVPTITLSDFDPSEIPNRLNMPWEDEMWHFFHMREKLRRKGNRNVRKGKSGFWKSTCGVEEIIDSKTNECIGKKWTLVFYEGPYPGKRTNWVIYEYELNHPIANQSDCFVICRLTNNAKKIGNTKKSKKAKKAKKDGDIPKSLTGEPSHFSACDETVLGHVHAESNYGCVSLPNLQGFNEAEPSFDFIPSSQIPGATSAVPDNNYEKDQPIWSPFNYEPLGFNIPNENTFWETARGFIDESSLRASSEMSHFLDHTEVYGSVNFLGPLAQEGCSTS